MLVLEKPLGFTRLNVLKDSPRSCRVHRSSVSLNVLLTVMSTLEKPGPRTTPRPAFPGRTAPDGTAAKHDALNQGVLVADGEPAYPWGALALGSQIMSGRGLAALVPRSPRPAGSTLDVVTVN